MSQRKRHGPTQNVKLVGKTLDRVCAAALHLMGYRITPSLRTLDLTKKVTPGCDGDCTIEIEVPSKDATHIMLSVHEGHEGMRFWYQTESTWQNFDLDQAAMKSFVDRLVEAAEWVRDDKELRTLKSKLLA